MKRTALVAGLSLLIAAGTVPPSRANELYIDAVKDYVQDSLRGWTNDQRIVDALKTGNAFHQYLTAEDIDAMDARWRIEFRSQERPLIRAVVDNSLSAFLRAKQKEADGLVTEIIVMDAKGLSIAESEASSDYWQGDEPKWQKTYLTGTRDIFIDRAEKDESTQMLQVQASMTVFDPETDQPIGAITIGINLDGL
ncbi:MULTISPECIES: hypothetical protein [unclassified Rhizobium]|uniref:hypothetical protein n=1 Tax=unclassified Rhizobium TaxID=2613769 RepID=UPI0006FAD05F|nr:MULTISPECIES: hypothetical protein [unclassified Rhizobium]KQV34795.1 hypothetical protein ASC86_14900 [Rhizobium sp. Root1212]KRD24128.1 hypothetical protein ASE37_14890 [Rhizobium sp. Root268]